MTCTALQAGAVLLTQAPLPPPSLLQPPAVGLPARSQVPRDAGDGRD